MKHWKDRTLSEKRAIKEAWRKMPHHYSDEDENEDTDTHRAEHLYEAHEMSQYDLR